MPLLCCRYSKFILYKPTTDNLREVRETRHSHMGYFVLFILLHETEFSCFAVEAVIVHETKGFPLAIKDKI